MAVVKKTIDENVFKATKNKKKNDDQNVFKATPNRGIDMAMVKGWEFSLEDDLAKLNEYTARRSKGGYMPASEIKTYQDIAKRYQQNRVQYESFLKSHSDSYDEGTADKHHMWLGSVFGDMNRSYDLFSQFKNEYEYNDAVKINELMSMSSTDIAPNLEKVKSGKLGEIAHTTIDGQNITWQALYDSKKAEEEFNAIYDPIRTSSDFEASIEKAKNFKNPDVKTAEKGKSTVNKVKYVEDNYTELAFGEANGGGSDIVHSRISLMTDEEKNIYNYYFGRGEYDKAEKYLKSIDSKLIDRFESKEVEGFKRIANQYPVIASAMSVPATLYSGTEYIKDSLNYFKTGELDDNHGANVSTAIRGTVTENTNLKIGNWDAFDFVYNTGMSMADSVTAMGTFGSAGGIVLGLSAAAQSTNDALNRGMSNSQAFWTGLSSGVAEGLFETLSIGNFRALKEVPATTFKEFAKNIGKSMLVNASEETLTEIANITYDTFVNGDFSNVETKYRAYLAAGMSEKEARNKVIGEIAVQIGEAAGSGALMGAGFGVAGPVANRITNSANNKAALDMYGSSQSELVAEGLASEAGSLSNTLAQKYQGRLDKGKNLTGSQLNRLVAANEQQFVAEDKAAITEAATSRLTELGESGDVKTIATALVKQAAGETLTRAEKQAIKNSKFGQRVANELDPDNIRSGQYTSAWAEGIDTNRINPEEYSRLVGEAENAQKAQSDDVGAGGTITPPTPETPLRANTEATDEPTTQADAPTEQVETVDVDEIYDEADDSTGESDADEGETITLENASKKYGAQALAMVHTYNDDQDVAKYDRAYEQAYNMGRSGVSLSYAMNSESTRYLTEKQRELAYEAGKAASDTSAIEKDAANRKAANGKKGRKRGVVRGDGVTISDLKKTFNDTQGKAYKILSTYAEATGIDIVLYKSEANAEGKFEGAQGKYKHSESGTIYIDINAGLAKIKNVDDLAKYTMLRTFAHEFSHFIENWNPIQYNEFRKVVFDTLTERGENVHDLIEEMQAANPGMSYDKASREVLAEAMTDILPDAKFVEMLATKHKTIFDKLLEKLKEFVADLKEYFNSIGHNRSREANALKEQVGDTIKYIDSIVDMFDKVAVEAVENYQATVATEEVTETVSETVAEAETTVTETQPETTTSEHGFTITDNVEHGSLEITFDEKPSEAVRDVLKENKFRWNGKKKVWYGYAEREVITTALDKAYEGETVDTSTETKPKSFAEVMENATQEERDEVVEAINENTKLSHIAPTEVRESVVPEETKPLKSEEAPVAETTTEAQEITLDKRTVKMLKSFGRLMIANMEKEIYITNGAIALPINDADVIYATSELHAGTTFFNDATTKLLKGATTPIESAPIEAKQIKLDKAIYIFDIGGQKLYFDKKMLSFLDGGTLYYGMFAENVGIIKSVNEDGSTKGYLIGLKIPSDSTIGDEKPSRLKSFAKKKADAIKPTENKEEAIENGTENVDTGEGVLESDSDGQGTSRLLDGSQVEDVQGTSQGGDTAADASERGAETSRDDDRTDTADRAGRSERVSEVGDLRRDDELITHKAAKEYASERGYRIEINKLAAKKNIIQADIYDKDNLPTFNPVIINTASDWNKVKEAIDAREKSDKAKAEQLHEEVEKQIEQKSTEKPKGNNFVIGDSLNLPKGDKARFRANVDAIRLIKQLETEGRYATAAEQEILSKYVGWGGLSNAFGELVYNRETRRSEMTPKEEWKKEFDELKGLIDEGIITEQEYKTMSSSTKNAHYTSVEVIRAMYDGLKQLGFKGGRMLEPSSGVGNFVGAMPTDMSAKVNSWTMVELERITGQIAKNLYPNADVRIQGFETANIPDNYMDVAIGNVPFGDYGVVDRTYPKRITKSIHNYFFAKSIDKVRPGGIVMFITSSFTMDSKDSAVRQYIMDRADLLGAIRLPETAFKDNARTDVVTDILILKKREGGTEYAGEDFLVADYDYKYGSYTSNYFKEHPEMVLGTPVTKRGMYGANTLSYEPFTDRGTLGDQIREAFKNVKGEMTYTAKLSPEKTNFAVERATKKPKSGGFVVNGDGSISRNENGQLVKVDADEKTAKRITGMLGIRDAYRTLANYLQQGQDAKIVKQARKALNAAYDAFVKEYGYLNSPANKKAIDTDPDSYSILSLENYDVKKKTAAKADIFTKDTISANKTVTHVDSVSEGVIASLNLTGGVDTGLIAKLTNRTAEDVTSEIITSRLAFKTRDGRLVARETYLAGNVRAKLREAESLVPYDKDYEHNVEELRRVIPKDIPYNEIYITPGATFIPNEVYADFIAHMLGGRNDSRYSAPDIEVGRTVSGEFKITLNNKRLKTNYYNTQTWSTARKSFLELIDAMMGSRTVKVNDTVEGPDGKKISVLNEAETEAANEKVKAIQKEFEEWLWKDENRRTELARLYNETFNAIVNPKYDGSNLTVNGINADFKLREHQANAVHRIISSGGNTLLAHRVGAGKTLEMAAAAMKLRELGVVKKPVFVVPKPLVAQWGVEFNSYFPASRLLVADDKSFTPANRKIFANKIANGDYDAVILSYEQFEKIPMSAEYQTKFYEEQISEILNAIAEEKAESRDGKGLTVKEMEKKKASLEKKLKELTSKPKDEDNINFEMLGIDSLFVDEAHNFKNLEYVSKMSNVAGLGSAKGSQRSFDLYTKVRYLQSMNGGRGIVFATATPVMNSMVELYIMQRYLQPDVLQQLGLKSFDAWAKQFGEVVNKWEINPSGTGMRQKQVFANFRNLNELQLLFRSFSDVLTEVPGLKIPKMKGGSVKIVECEPGEFQKDYMLQLQQRAEVVKSVDPSIDNMLKITSDGRKVSYTQRMIDPSLPYEVGCKIYRCCENVLSEYKDSSSIKGTQIIFCDMATPKGTDKSKAENTADSVDDTFDEGSAKLYDDMRAYLVKNGIPSKEIAFIHEADSDAKRKQLFADVNDGKVRILIGSTGKMGVGMNAQKRIVAIHHLDAPWRPGDVEQRDGRAFRQKNMNEEVSKYVYVTKGSFDSRLWDILDRKQHFIGQIMNGEDVGRTAEDTGEVTLSAAEVKALASGNPLIEEQTKLTDAIKKLENLQKAYNSSLRLAKTKLSDDEQKIVYYKNRIANIREDIKSRVDTYSEGKFSMNVGGQVFTDKKDAGVALAAEISSKVGRDAYVTVGKFAGFELKVIREAAEYKGFIQGKANYKFNVYLGNTTRMVNHIGEIIAGFENQMTNAEQLISDTTADLKVQQEIISKPFEKAEELAAKRARFNEVMELLAPKNEQQLGNDSDDVQYQSRAYLDDDIKVINKKAVMTEERIDYLIEDSGAGKRQDYAQAWITSISPTDYLNLTTSERIQDRAVFDEFGSEWNENVNNTNYDYLGQLKKSIRQTPYLAIDISTGEVVGHDGRHRVRALEMEGIESVEIKVEFRDEGGYIVKYSPDGKRLQIKDSLKLINQFGTKQTATIKNVIPLNKDYRAEILNNYGEILAESDDIRYQQRTEALTNREILELAADEVKIDGLTDAQKDALGVFKQRLLRLQELQQERAELGRQYKEQQFGEKVDRKAAAETLNRMHILDDQIERANDELFSIEEKPVLRKVLEKARKVVEQNEREHGNELLKRYRDRRNNAAAIKKYRERLRKDVDDLSGWILHPDNKSVVKHVPDVLKNSVIPFLSSINFMSKRALNGKAATKADQAFMEHIKKLNAALKVNIDAEGMYSGYTDLPPDFMNRLQTFIDTTDALVKKQSGELVINQMTSEELKDLSKIVRTLKKYIMQINSFHYNAMYEHVYDAGENSIEHLTDLGNAGNTGTVSNFLLWQQMRPAYAFERFGNGGIAIYDGLRRGQAQLAFNTKEIQKFTEEAYTEKEVKAWEDEIKTFRFGKDIVKMPVSYIMSFYELSKDPEALEHINGEGIRVATFTRKGKKISDTGHILTLGDFNQLIGSLTDRQKEVADSLQKYMATQGGKWGNFVSVARFGEELFTNPNYFPINSDGRHLQATADEHPSAAALYALLNMSFTKQRKEGANNRIVIYSIFDVFSNHMASMAQYNAMALPILDALKWFNYRQVFVDDDGNKQYGDSVRERMDRAYGVPEETRPGKGKSGYAQDFVMNIIKAFNGTEAQGTPYDTWGLKSLHRYNAAQVAYNFRVVLQQPMAITRAGMLIDYRSILKGMKLNPVAIKQNITEMQEHSGIAAWKSLGFYDVNISRGLTSLIKHDNTFMDKVIDIGMWGAEKADTLTWAAIWSACKEEVRKKQHLTPESEGFYEAVTKLFEDVIYKTQVVDSVLTKNEFMRDKGAFARLVGSFMSEPTTNASMVIDSFNHLSLDRQRGMNFKEAWQKNSKLIGRTMYVYAVGAVLLAAVQAAADAFRDDDDYEEPDEKWFEAFVGNFVDELLPFNKLPIISDFYDLGKEILSIFGVDTYGNPPQSVFMQWYDSLIKGTEIIYEKISGEDINYTWYGGIYKLLQAVSGMTGAPMASATREIITAWNNTVGAMAPSLKVKTYDMGDEAEIKYAYLDGYLTDDEAAKTLLEEGVVESEDEARYAVRGWKEDITTAAAEQYMTHCEPAGVPLEVFNDAWEYNNNTEADKDKNGESIYGSKKEKVLEYINSLDLSDEQKDSLYFAFGWSKKNINEAPWN